MNSTSKANNTTKKTKIIGTEQYINSTTGKVEDFQVIRMEDRDFDFTKIWLTQVIASLDLIGNKKTKVALWIMDNLNRENQLCYTQRQIAEKTGFALETVRLTMKNLLDCNFLRKQNMGVYMVNPDMLFKGKRPNRLNVLLQYENLPSKPNDKSASDAPTAPTSKKKSKRVHKDTPRH